MNVHATDERISAFVETTTEFCFGAIMGITAALGMFGVVSFLISYVVVV